MAGLEKLDFFTVNYLLTELWSLSYQIRRNYELGMFDKASKCAKATTHAHKKYWNAKKQF